MKNRRLHRVVGFDYHFADGRTAYYFVLVSALKETLLRKKLKLDAACNLAEYGEVILSGYGVASEEEKRFLREEYGCPV